MQFFIICISYTTTSWSCISQARSNKNSVYIWILLVFLLLLFLTIADMRLNIVYLNIVWFILADDIVGDTESSNFLFLLMLTILILDVIVWILVYPAIFLLNRIKVLLFFYDVSKCVYDDKKVEWINKMKWKYNWHFIWMNRLTRWIFVCLTVFWKISGRRILLGGVLCNFTGLWVKG